MLFSDFPDNLGTIIPYLNPARILRKKSSETNAELRFILHSKLIVKVIEVFGNGNQGSVSGLETSVTYTEKCWYSICTKVHYPLQDFFSWKLVEDFRHFSVCRTWDTSDMRIAVILKYQARKCSPPLPAPKSLFRSLRSSLGHLPSSMSSSTLFQSKRISEDSLSKQSPLNVPSSPFLRCFSLSSLLISLPPRPLLPVNTPCRELG